jgi:hypothetical protein
MFPFRPSRAATALLEVAEAMLAPDAIEPTRDGDPADRAARERDTTPATHPHRRSAAIDRSRRPAPPQPAQRCLTPLTRAARAREALRS